MRKYKKIFTEGQIPKYILNRTIDTIQRIEDRLDVIGILFIVNDKIEICTLPDTMVQTLSIKLLQLSEAIHRAVTEIDVQDELVAFRIVSKKLEILVTSNKEFLACVLLNTSRKGENKTKKK